MAKMLIVSIIFIQKTASNPKQNKKKRSTALVRLISRKKKNTVYKATAI